GSGQVMAVGATAWHSVLAYGASHPDHMDAYGTNKAALASHYLTTGHAQGRQVTFDPLRYMASNVDLMASYEYSPDTLATHYSRWGRNEHRSIDGNLQMQVAAGAGTLNGQVGKKDGLFGSAGDDQLFGMSGDDALRGGAGNDLL